MRKNTEKVFNAWINERPLNGPSISTDGRTIFSYSTPILSRESDGIFLNTKKYSNTTSRQQSDLSLLLGRNGIKFSNR